MVLKKDSSLRAYLAITGLIAALGLPWSGANAECLSVLFPEVREPYRSVLEEIITGIQEGSRWSVHRVSITEPIEPAIKSIRRSGVCDGVVGLGREGFEAAMAFVGKRPVIAGAVVIAPGDISAVPTVSLVPDARELFERLVHFIPRIRSVTVVVDPTQNRLMIEQASRDAEAMGLELEILEAKSLRKAMVAYRDVLDHLDPDSEALWLLQDSTTVDRRNVLPFVLKRAWIRGIAVFSSQPAYVKNGVLFSVYPDNLELGRRLGELARQCVVESCTPNRVMPLRSLRTAVNLRTADHLGLEIDPRRDHYVDLTFPGSR